MIQKVGYQTKNPNEKNPKEVADYYASLAVGKDYYENGVAAVIFARNITWDYLLKPTDRNLSDMTSTTLNAY